MKNKISIVVFALAVDGHPSVAGILLQGRCQQTGMQNLLAIDLPALLDQESPDFGDVIRDPPQTVASLRLPLPVVVGSAQGGECTRSQPEWAIDLVHHEIKDICLSPLLGLQVVL